MCQVVLNPFIFQLYWLYQEDIHDLRQSAAQPAVYRNPPPGWTALSPTCKPMISMPWSRGRYPILGEDVWLRISDNSTKPESEAVYEAHDRFIDIQMILRGEEIIRCAFRRDMVSVTESHPDRDVTFYQGSGQPFLLSAGDFLISFSG